MLLSSSQSHSAEGGGDYYYYNNNTRPSSTLADDWVVPQSTDVLKADFLPPGYVYGYGQKMEMNQDYSATPASAGGDIVISSTLPSSSYAATSLLPTVSPHVSAPTSHGLPDSTPLTQKPKRRRKGPQKTPGKTAKNKERHFVQHNYHDLATEPDSIIGSDHESSSGLSDDAFPMRLHRMLDEVDKEGYAHIISWQPHGRAFIIRDTCLFSQIIMPKYFPTSKKITSIQRQFNLYGFEKLTRDGPDQGAYYHEAFLRGRPELSSRRMVRKRVKGTGHKACSNPDAEPDFYSMPFVAVSGCGSSNSVNGTISQASAAPTLDGMRSSVTSEESDDYYYYQGSLNQQQQQVQPLFTSSQQMFQSYSAPTSRNGTSQHQKNTYTCTRSTTEEIDDEPIDLFHFDWGDAEMFRS